MIPVNEPLLDGDERSLLMECIDTGWISSEGPFVARFEEEMALRLGRKCAVAVASGTAALDIAIAASGIGPGDEIILPAFTIISCIGQIVRSGATPVLVDSDPDTWNMDLTSIRSKLSSRTKAIMAVHIYGLPVDMDPLLEFAEQHGLFVIEDAAQLIGQTYKGRACGSFGQISTFSFYPNKHITTGEGGMILTDDAQLAEECRSLRNLCFIPGKRFVHERLGWNYRMTNLQAALGVAQLRKLDATVEIKRRIGRRYTELLSGLESVRLPVAETEYSENIYWVYGLVLREQQERNAVSVMDELSARGIGTRPFFCPMHLQPVLRNLGLFVDETYPVSEGLYENGFYIPSGVGLSDAQAEEVAAAVIDVLR